MNDILQEAQAILGPPVRIEAHRGWAVFWCPFHNDTARSGQGGQPNLGVNIRSPKGYWKCLRCGESGASLGTLRRKLGVSAPVSERPTKVQQKRPQSRLADLDEAITEARSALMSSPAWAYLQTRGIRSHTALTYGLGYGVPKPKVNRDTLEQARKSRLIGKQDRWLWAGGVVYADPLIKPVTIQTRHLLQKARMKYQTWGRLVQPLGAWRIKPSTKIIIVIEGLMDMLMFFQALRDRQATTTVPVYTGGAAISWAMRNWFQEHNKFGYLLVPDPDEAGEEWTKTIRSAIRNGRGVSHISPTPKGLDPDEALLAGWWPDGL